VKTIATYNSVDEAFLARSRLEGDGVKSFIPDEFASTGSWGGPQTIGGVRLQVEDEDYDQASKVLGLRPPAHRS
jgi:Putative prokaryotic signal transducing protein